MFAVPASQTVLPLPGSPSIHRPERLAYPVKVVLRQQPHSFLFRPSGNWARSLLRRLRGVSHRYLSEMSHLILSWRIAGVEGAVMISHRCLKPGRNPLYLPPLVPSRSSSRSPATGLRQRGVPGSAPAEDASRVAPPEPGLRHRLPDRPAGGTNRTACGAAGTRALGPTTLGVRERPVWGPRR